MSKNLLLIGFCSKSGGLPTSFSLRRFFSHTNPDGLDPFDRLRAAGIRYRAAAENLAEGRATGRDTYDDWIESDGHRRNIENCEFTSLGIGLVDRRWTLLLARYED